MRLNITASIMNGDSKSELHLSGVASIRHPTSQRCLVVAPLCTACSFRQIIPQSEKKIRKKSHVHNKVSDRKLEMVKLNSMDIPILLWET